MRHRLPIYADGKWGKGLVKEMTKKSTSVISFVTNSELTAIFDTIFDTILD